MKKAINKYLIGAAVLAMTVTSCSKNYITKSPDDQLLFNEAISTTPALQSALNGAYNQMGQVGVFGRDLPVVADVMADNPYVQPKNSKRNISQYTYTVPSQHPLPRAPCTACY